MPFKDWRPSVVAGLIAFAIFRLGAELAALLSVYGGGFIKAVAHSPHALEAVWFRWDAGWYLSIATLGYVKQSHVPIAGGFQDATAFAPLYPAITRAGIDVLHLSAKTSATLVAAGALLLALIVVHRLGRLELGRNGGTLALIAVLAYPDAFFLAAPYAESLLLLCVAGALLAARTRHWLVAAFFAFAATLTKTYMALLIAPLLIEYMEQRQWSLRRVRVDAAAVVAGPVVAIGLLMAYMQYRFHDPIRFLRAEASWQHRLSSPTVAISQAVSDLTGARVPPDTKITAGFELICIPLLVVAAVYAWFRWRRSYAVFMMLPAIVFVTSGTLRSTNRYVLTIVPVFILVALLLRARPKVFAAAAAVSTLAGLYFLHEFVTNHFVG